MKREVVDMTETELMKKLDGEIQRAGFMYGDAAILAEIDPQRLRSCLDGAEEMDAVEYLSLCRLLKLNPYYASK